MSRRRGVHHLFREVRELRGVVRLLAPYTAGTRGAIAAGAALTAALLALRLAQPWPLKWILDGLLESGSQPLSPMWAAALFLLISVVAASAEYLQVTGLVGLGNRILYRFRAALFQHVLGQSLAFHQHRKEGELLTRIVYDTTRLRKGVNQTLIRFFQTLLTFVSTVAVLLWVDVFLAVCMGLGGLLAFYLMARGTRRVKKAAKKNRRREGKLASLVTDELLAIRDLQTFRPEAGSSLAFERINAKSLKQEGKIRRLSSGLLVRVEVIVSCAIAVILFLGAERVARGEITAGELVLFVSYAKSLYHPFFRFARQSTRLGTTLASAHRLEGLMKRKPAIVDAPDAKVLDRAVGRVEFRDVGLRTGSRSKGTRRWLLRDLTFSVPAGERVAVVGANGAGKSTLLGTLLRLSQWQTGEILLDGAPLDRFTIASLRGRMSVVFQGSVFFGMTLRENLSLGRPSATDAEIWAVLERVGAAHLVEEMSEGLDTVMKKGGKLMSEGQRQKLAIARALITDGDLWLLDEPTTSLDAASSWAAESALLEATQGRTTLWVTHDPRIATRLDRTLVLAEGAVAFLGSADEYARTVNGAPSGPDVPVLRVGGAVS